MRFQGKVAVVTGAGLGIGQAAAAAFAREGAQRGRRGSEPGERRERGSGASNEGLRGLFVLADVSSEADVNHMVEQVVAHWGRLDILVNNAGIYIQGDVTQTALDDWDRILAVNLTGRVSLHSVRRPGDGEKRRRRDRECRVRGRAGRDQRSGRV